jgi:hypothetical protein
MVEDRVLQVRAKTNSREMPALEGIPVQETVFGAPYLCTTTIKGQDEQPFEGVIPGLPTYEEVRFVVSALSLQAINNEEGLEQFDTYHFFAPGKPIRDTEGKIIGSEGLTC